MTIPFGGQLLDTAAYLPDVGVVVGQLPGQKGASPAAPKRVDPEFHDKIDQLLDTYARLLAQNMNKG